MKIKINGQVRTAANLMQVPMKDYLRLSAQTEALGKRWTMSQVMELERQLAEAESDSERAAHPEFLFYLVLLVWATLASDGDPDAFDKAISMKLEDYEFLDDPADHKAAAKPRAAKQRPAKARAAVVRARSTQARTKKTPDPT